MAATKKTTNGFDAFESMTAFGPEAFKEGYEKIASSVSAMADFHKGTMEAAMASAGAFAKGFEKMTSENTTFAKSAFEESVANAKATAASKSPQEAFDLTSEFVRTSMEKNLGQINKVADICIETAKESSDPLTTHYGELIEKIQAYRP